MEMQKLKMQKLKMRKHGNAKVENTETWKCKSWKCGNMEIQKLKMRKHGNAKCILWCRVWATVLSFVDCSNRYCWGKRPILIFKIPTVHDSEYSYKFLIVYNIAISLSKSDC
jgi:hypothetical protein